MRRKYQPVVVMGLSAIVLPGVSTAAAPVNFDGWSASSGNIDTSLSCSAAGVTSCRTLAEDKGFIQEEMVVDDYTYIRLIVTDPNADGAPSDQGFVSESFVPFAFNNEGISQGLAAKQVVRDFAEGFTDQAEVQRAMMRFRDPGMKNPADLSGPTPADEMWSIRLTQTFDRSDLQSVFQFENYTAMATFPAATPDTNDVIGYKMSISQTIPFDPTGSAGIDPDAKQKFEHRQIAGAAGNFPIPLFFPSSYYAYEPLTPAGDMTVGGKTVSWSETDAVSTSWVVQTDLFDTTNVSISSQTVTNLTTGDEASQTDTIAISPPVSPFDWHEPTFGPEPSFP